MSWEFPVALDIADRPQLRANDYTALRRPVRREPGLGCGVRHGHPNDLWHYRSRRKGLHVTKTFCHSGRWLTEGNHAYNHGNPGPPSHVTDCARLCLLLASTCAAGEGAARSAGRAATAARCNRCCVCIRAATDNENRQAAVMASVTHRGWSRHYSESRTVEPAGDVYGRCWSLTPARDHDG